MSSGRITEAEGRKRWTKAIADHGWNKSRLAKVMFDWKVSDRATTYCPNPPAWTQIVDPVTGDASEADFESLVKALIERGLACSGKKAGTKPPKCQPLGVTRDVVVDAIQAVAAHVQPLFVWQEQVLRCALVGQLPVDLVRSIGTPTCTVYPEMPTPTGGYGVGEMRARYDLGFGYPSDPEDDEGGITGVVELKVAGSFDQSFPPGLTGDFAKLLDPGLPTQAFKISLLVTQRRPVTTPAEIAKRADAILAELPASLSTAMTASADPKTGWRSYTAGAKRLELAWYWPNQEGRLVPVWA